MTLASRVLLASLPVLISLYTEKYRQEDFSKSFPNDPADYNLPVKEVFNFVIVGGGTAGCILANRLSEQFSILLLEAGGTPPPLQDVPFTFNYTKTHPDINFIYESVPQKSASLEDNGVVLSTAGKMLGGSSSHHGMTYERGNPMDYDQWASVTGDESWSYKNVLPFFRKSESYRGKLDLDMDHHGECGPVHTEEESFSPGIDIWLKAGQELGFKTVDSNGPQTIGFSKSIFTKRNGRRESSYTSYIKPIEDKRKNLRIYRYSPVSQIIFEDKRATGVHYTRHGVPRVAFASKEVILSAGTFVSPLILIKSGIGPLDELNAAKVEPVSVLPVGENLMDHPIIALAPIQINKPEYSWNPETNLTFEDFDNFVKNGKGPLTISYHGSAGAFLASGRDFRNWPDLQVYYSYVGDEPSSVVSLVEMNRPKSRGRIRLNNTAMSMLDNHLPIIDLNYFDADSDLEVLVDGIELTLKVYENTTAFQNLGARYAAKPHKSCTEHNFRSRDYWKCYVKQTARSTWHTVGTCKMGAVEDPSTVVDTKLRVHGVTNLRVVDASIMPFAPNANTVAAVMMIAEKAADALLFQYSKIEGIDKSEL